MIDQEFIPVPSPVRLAIYLKDVGAINDRGVNLTGNGFHSILSPLASIFIKQLENGSIEMHLTPTPFANNEQARKRISTFTASTKERCAEILTQLRSSLKAY